MSGRRKPPVPRCSGCGRATKIRDLVLALTGVYCRRCAEGLAARLRVLARDEGAGGGGEET